MVNKVENRLYTETERFSVTHMMVSAHIRMENICNYPLLGVVRPLTAALVPVTVTIDILAHAGLFAIKLIPSVLSFPVSFVGTLINRDWIPEDFTVTSLLVHVTAAFEGIVHLFVLPIIVFVDPLSAKGLISRQMQAELDQRIDELAVRCQRLQEMGGQLQVISDQLDQDLQQTELVDLRRENEELRAEIEHLRNPTAAPAEGADDDHSDGDA